MGPVYGGSGDHPHHDNAWDRGVERLSFLGPSDDQLVMPIYREDRHEPIGVVLCVGFGDLHRVELFDRKHGVERE